MKIIKPFGPTIGKTKVSKKLFDILNKEFDTKSKSKKLIIVQNLPVKLKMRSKFQKNL